MIKLWVDDEREPPDSSWDWSLSYYSAYQKILEYIPDEISLDHDLGSDRTGYDLLMWMIDINRVPSVVKFHSMNPVGRQRMEKALESFKRRI